MILRHNIKRDLESEYPAAEKKLEKYNGQFDYYMSTGKKINLWGFKNTSLRYATYSIVLNRNEKTREALKYYLEFGIGHFKRMVSNDKTTEITVNNKIYEVSSLESRNELTYFNWWNLFIIATIIKCENLIRELIRIHQNVDFNECQDKFWNQVSKYSLKLFLEEKSDEELYSNIKEDANSGMVQFYGLEEDKLIYSNELKFLRCKIWLPIIELQRLISRREDNLFNEKLREYIEFKKAWIINQKEQDNSSYWVDFSILYCCILAQNNKIEIKIESDYIPKFVVDGEF